MSRGETQRQGKGAYRAGAPKFPAVLLTSERTPRLAPRQRHGEGSWWGSHPDGLGLGLASDEGVAVVCPLVECKRASLARTTPWLVDDDELNINPPTPCQ